MQIDPTQATGKTEQLFDDLQAKLGFVPNLFRVLANAPAALEGYLNFTGALAGGSLNSSPRANRPRCRWEQPRAYCLSPHTFPGGKVGLSQKDVTDAIRATAARCHPQARSTVVQRGEVSDSDLARARVVGLTDAEIVETVANVVLNIFFNYVNHVARTLLDFPEVKPVDAST
jgi:alkylhydroperoxidase family enzyme